MRHPSDHEDMIFLRDLAAWSDGTMPEARADQWDRALIDDPDKRREFIWHNICTVQLREYYSSMKSHPGSRWRGVQGGSAGPIRVRRLSALAVSVVVLISLSVWHSFSGSRDRGCATLTYAEVAQWAQSSLQPNSSGRLKAGIYILNTGRIRLEMHEGTMVSLAGPARFKLLADDRLQLDEGTLTVRVWSEQSHFTVLAGGTEIRDLGTAFGIHASGDQKVGLSVFEGEVMVFDRHREAEPLQLERGNAVILDGSGGIQPTVYDVSIYRDLWPLTNHVDSTSPLVHFIGPELPRPLKQYQSNQVLFMLPERQNVILERPLRVSVEEPGDYMSPELYEDIRPLAETMRVNSYLVFFNSEEPKSEAWYEQLTGSVTFARPIVGIIATPATLAESDTIVGLPGIEYGGVYSGRGLDMFNVNAREAQRHDRIRVHADRRTLSFTLNVGPQMDQFRVLTRAE